MADPEAILAKLVGPYLHGYQRRSGLGQGCDWVTRRADRIHRERAGDSSAGKPSQEAIIAAEPNGGGLTARARDSPVH